MFIETFFFRLEREINFQFENVSIMKLFGWRHIQRILSRSYFVRSFIRLFISCFDVRISSFSLFIFVFLFYFIRVEVHILFSFSLLIWFRSLYISFVDSLTLNGFQDVRFACVYNFRACWMKGTINWRVTSDFQLIKRLTMASKWHDSPRNDIFFSLF